MPNASSSSELFLTVMARGILESYHLLEFPQVGISALPDPMERIDAAIKGKQSKQRTKVG